MILLALAVSAAQPAETPRRFLDRIYAGYKHSDFSPLVHPDRYFAPPLVAAIARICGWRTAKSAISTEILFVSARTLRNCVPKSPA